MLRLGYHYHLPALLGTDGGLRTPAYQGRFLDALADGCQELVCFLHPPRPDEMAHMDYTCRARNLTYVPLGPHDSVPKRLLRSWAVTALVRRHRSKLDALLIRGPSPLLPAVAKGADGTPVALLLVGDYVAGIADLVQPWWRKQIITAWIRWNNKRQTATMQHCHTFVNSGELYEKLKSLAPRLRETRTTNLTEADFHSRPDTCVSRPIRLLYTGRLTQAKGLLQMVEATALLIERGEDVVLHLVGSPEPGENILQQIREAARERAIEGRIIYDGYKRLGAELSESYLESDIYLIASRNTEGFPRAIWEALAHSLPVVASRVGSIPLFLTDRVNACLVERNNPSGLVEAIAEIIHDRALRRRLIHEGHALARAHTLERLTPILLSEIAEFADERCRTRESRMMSV